MFKSIGDLAQIVLADAAQVREKTGACEAPASGQTRRGINRSKEGNALEKPKVSTIADNGRGEPRMKDRAPRDSGK